MMDVYWNLDVDGRVRRARVQEGLLPGALAARLGVAAATLYLWEEGRVPVPPQVVVPLAAALGREVRDLFPNAPETWSRRFVETPPPDRGVLPATASTDSATRLSPLPDGPEAEEQSASVDLSGQLSMLRLARGLHQHDIAARVGVETSVVAGWEMGAGVPIGSLQTLAEALDVLPGALLRDSQLPSASAPTTVSSADVPKDVWPAASADAQRSSPRPHEEVPVWAASADVAAALEAVEGEWEVAEDTPDDLLDGSARVEMETVQQLSSASRVDSVLPFVGLLPLDALYRLVEETSSALEPFELPSADVERLLDDVSLRTFAHEAAEVALDFVPAEQILRRPLDSLVRPLHLLADRAITADHLSPTLLATVRQHTAADWGALGSMHLGDVLEWPAGSVGSVKEILASAIQWGLLALQAQANLTSEPASEHARVRRTPAESDLVRAIRTIATWATAVSGSGSVADALLLAAQAADLPPEVASARGLLVSVDARSLASSGVTAYDPDAALQRVLRSVDASELPVLLARPMALLDPPTLGELADRAGVSRERIRQLEAKGLDKLRAALGKPRNRVISSAARQFAAHFGAAAPVAALLDTYPDALTNDVRTLSQEAIRARILLWVAGPYEVKGEWLVRAPYEELIRQTAAALDHVTTAGPVPREEALSALERLDIAAPYRERWLDHVPGFRTIDGRFVAWRGTLLDKAETILRLRGEPLTKEQLAEAIGESSARGIANRLFEDPRFMRSSVKQFALREWGLEEYSSVEEEMAEEIRRQGGEAEIDHLVDVLTRKFGVSESSVRIYAGGPNFIRTRRGAIRLRTEDDPLPVAPPVDQAKRCYRLAQGWACRLTVTSDILRGSGVGVHPGFVSHVGVACLESKTVPSAFGPISVGWSSLQAWLGSLRAVVEGLNAHVGDYLFVEYVPPGEFQYTLVRSDELEAAAPDERLALEVGTRLDRWNGDALAALAHALGFATGSDQSPSALRLRLRSRGEEDLVSLVDESATVVHDDQSLP